MTSSVFGTESTNYYFLLRIRFPQNTPLPVTWRQYPLPVAVVSRWQFPFQTPKLRRALTKPMALSAARRLSTTTSTSSSAAAAAAPPKLSSLFRNPKPRPRPDPGVDAPRRGPRPKPRQPWEEEAGALLRRLHEGGYLPGPDLSSAPHAASPDSVKTAAERFGHDHQPVAKWASPPTLFAPALIVSMGFYINLKSLGTECIVLHA